MKKVIKLLGNFLSIVAIVFIAYTLYKMDIDFERIVSTPNILLWTILGVVLSAITVVLLGVAWTRTLSYFSKQKVSYKEGIFIYSKANLGKYIPGNVMHYVERNLFAKNIGLDHLETAISTGFEIIGLIIASVLISIIFSYKNLIGLIKHYFTWEVVVLIFALLIVVIVAAVFIVKNSEKVRTIYQKICSVKFVLTYIVNILIYVLVFLILGAIMVLLVNALEVNALSAGEIPIIVATYTLAWVLGFLVPGAPGGIGVREFVISFVLGESKLAEAILIAAVMHRIITIIGDVVSYIGNMLLKKMEEHK